MASNSGCRQHPPMVSAAYSGRSFGAQQQRQADSERTKVVIDYSPGPDSVSKVMRRRTLSAMELQGDDASWRDAQSQECSKKANGLTNERHSCKPLMAMGAEGIVGSRQRDVSREKGAMQSQCAKQQEDDIQITQQPPVPQSDHRCNRVTTGQECKPKPNSKKYMFPQLSLALIQLPAESNSQFPKVDRPRCKQPPKGGKRGVARRSSSTNFPQFEDGKAKKKLRVSFANKAEKDVTAIYTRCDPKWQERLASDVAKKRRNAAAEDDTSVNQSKQGVRERQPRSREDSSAKTELQTTATKPNNVGQLMKGQRTQQQQQPVAKSPSNGKLQETQRDDAQRVNLNELQKCLCMCGFDVDHLQQANTAEEQIETSLQEVQHQKKECPEYKTMKEDPSTCGDMYQQESSVDSNESEQMKQQYVETSQKDQKPSEPDVMACQDAGRQHQCEGQIYSRRNHVEFETNTDDDEHDDRKRDRQKDRRRCSDGHVQAELEINRAGQIEAQHRNEHAPLMAQPKRDSEDYSLQIGVKDFSKAVTSLAEDQQVAGKKGSQARGHSCQEEQQVRRCNSQQRSQPQSVQQPLQRQSCAQKPSCVGFQSGGAKQQRRSVSEPCMQRNRRNSPPGQQSKPVDSNEQKTWKQDDCKDLPQPQLAAGCTKRSEQKQPKESPSISDSCQEALRQDAERRKRREMAERAREAAVQETLMKPKQEVAQPSKSGGTVNQPALVKPVEVGCHCSLHLEQSCDGPVKEQTNVQRVASKNGSKEQKFSPIKQPNVCGNQSPCLEDAGNVEWIRDGHLLVKMTNGKPSVTKVMSKSEKSDIYGSGEQPQQPAEKEESTEELSTLAGISPSDSNDQMWLGNTGENTTETTDDAGDPVSGSKKKCCC